MNNSISQFINTAKNEPKSSELLIIKLMEEVGEVSEAYLSCNHSTANENKKLTTHDFQEELVDTLMVTATLLVKSGISQQNFDKLFRKKIKKWQSKQ